MNREKRDLLTACRIHGLDSGRLHRRAKMMLGFRHKRVAYKGMYDRKERMNGRGRRTLTDRQKNLLRCIVKYQKEYGFSPSVRDLCAGIVFIVFSNTDDYKKEFEKRIPFRNHILHRGVMCYSDGDIKEAYL